MRLGPSDSYERRYGVECRNTFLGAVAQHAPQVLSNLDLEVFPIFEKTMHLVGHQSNSALDQQSKQLDQALLGWARRYHLECRWEHNWLLQVALETMHGWQKSGAERGRQWRLYRANHKATDTTFHMQAGGYDPLAETPQEARQRLRQEFKQQVSTHIKKTRRKQPQYGGNRVHFEWLVQYLILQRDLQEIATLCTSAVDAARILQAIHPLTVILGLKWVTLGQSRTPLAANN